MNTVNCIKHKWSVLWTNVKITEVIQKEEINTIFTRIKNMLHIRWPMFTIFREIPIPIFMFAPCINSIKTLFIVPTDAHYYKIIEMLKQFKVIILAPTCSGSRRNHHQGAVLCLAKITNMVFCAHRYRCSQCYVGISARCAGVRFSEQADMLP